MTNPKDIQGEKKPPLHLIPLNAKIAVAMAMKNGASKYGPFNWRELDIQASAYIGAAQRHIDLWFDCNEEEAKDSGVHHLGHAMATLGILYDALVNGSVVDDRPAPSKASELMDKHTVGSSAQESSPEKVRQFPKAILSPMSGVTKIDLPPHFKRSGSDGSTIINLDDPRVFNVESTIGEGVEATAQIIPKLDRDSIIDKALEQWDVREYEDGPGWKRRLFRRSVIRKLDEVFGVDLDWIAPEDARRNAPEGIFYAALRAGHSDAALKALLNELFGEEAPYKGARTFEGPWGDLCHEPRSHGSPGRKTFVGSTDMIASDIVDEILGPLVEEADEPTNN